MSEYLLATLIIPPSVRANEDARGWSSPADVTDRRNSPHFVRLVAEPRSDGDLLDRDSIIFHVSGVVLAYESIRVYTRSLSVRLCILLLKRKGPN